MSDRCRLANAPKGDSRDSTSRETPRSIHAFDSDQDGKLYGGAAARTTETRGVEIICGVDNFY